MGERPFPWEASYPHGIAWDAPIERSTLPRLLARAAERHGARAAFEFRDRLTSFVDLARDARGLAHGLAGLGLGKGQAVALYLPNTPAHPISFFGVGLCGAHVVHLSPLDAERVLIHKLTDSGARTLVVMDLAPMADMALKLLAAGHLDRLLVVEDALFGPSGLPTRALPDDPRVIRWRALIDTSAPASLPDVAPDDLALVQYTGGTTGLPKGAMLTHGSITAAVSIYGAWQNFLPMGPPEDDRIILVLPLFHIYALTAVMLRQIDRGSCMLLRMRFDLEETIRDIEVKRATVFPGVPTMWIALINHPRFAEMDLSSLAYAASGGAPLPVEIARKFEDKAGMRLAGGWGMTETSPAGTQVPTVGKPKPGTIGLPMPGLEMDVAALEDPARVLPPGEVGELRIRGPNVFKGYWNNPKETAASFVGDWFLTGDIGFMDEDGYFFIVDRKKDMILSGGFNVYPQMIEQMIYEHPAVEEVIVVGVPDAYRGEAAKAFVKLKAGAEPFTLEALKTFLATRVGKHEMPAGLEFRDALPKTAVGKLSRAELRAEIRAREQAA